MSWEERRIDKLKGLDPGDAAAFKAAGVNTLGAAVEEYETAAGSSNLAALARKVAREETETAKVLASVFPDAARRITSGWLSRHWADVTVCAAATGFAIALLWVPVRAWMIGSNRSSTVPKVFAARTIPAGSVVQPTDLRVSGTGRDPAADVAAVLSGGQTTVAIPAGSEIKPGMLGGKTLPGRLLTLPLQHMPALGSRKLPLDVDLVFSSRRGAPAGGVFKVTLLEASPASQPTMVTFRLAEKDLAEAAKWIGSADTTVSFPEP